MPNLSEMSVEQIDDWAMNEMLGKRNSLDIVLRGHLVVEQILEELVSKSLVEPNALWSKERTFSLKLDLAIALGKVPKELSSAIRALNRLRKKYAHDASFECSLESLNSFKLDWAENQKEAFRLACSQSVHKAAELCVIFLVWKVQLLLVDG